MISDPRVPSERIRDLIACPDGLDTEVMSVFKEVLSWRNRFELYGSPPQPGLYSERVLVQQAEPVAWMTNETPPRVASNWSREGMFAVAKESYCIPLYRQPITSHDRLAQAKPVAEVAMNADCTKQFIRTLNEAVLEVGDLLYAAPPFANCGNTEADQPNFDSREVSEYAKRMGLPTEFEHGPTGFTAPVIWGPEKQDLGGPVYRTGSSTGVSLSLQPAEQSRGKWVPIEPTFRHRFFLEGKTGVDWLEGWKAMLAAAPESEGRKT